MAATEDDRIDLHSEPTCSVVECAVQDSRPLPLSSHRDRLSSPCLDANMVMQLKTSTAASCRKASTIQPNQQLERMLQQHRQQISLSPPPFLEAWADAEQGRRPSQHSSLARRGEAYFILSHEGELEEGVIETVRAQMMESARGRHDDIIFKLQGSAQRPFLHINASSEGLAARCLDEARACADNLIYDQSVKLESVLLEPLDCPIDVAEVIINNGRPQLGPNLANVLGADNLTRQRSQFGDDMCRQLATALKKAGRIKDRINLRIHFGQSRLTSVPQPSSIGPDGQTYANTERLIKALRQGRLKSDFQTQISGQDEAYKVLGALKANSSFFLPLDMAVDTKYVRPEFYFEGQSSKWQLDAEIKSIDVIPPGQSRKGAMFEVIGIRASQVIESCPGSQLKFQLLGVDKVFDWNIETIPERLVKQDGYETLKSEIKAASIQFQEGPETCDQDFPRLYFKGCPQRARELSQVAIKSVFRFRYDPAPYQIDFTIRREWPSIQAMVNNRIKPTTTFGITIYGEHWGETRASDVAKTGQGWGAELEHLFGDCRGSIRHDDNDSHMTGEARVQNLINIVHDIRRVLSV